MTLETLYLMLGSGLAVGSITAIAIGSGFRLYYSRTEGKVLEAELRATLKSIIKQLDALSEKIQ